MPDTTLPLLTRVHAGHAAERGRTPTVVIRRRQGLFDLDLSDVWEYRELLYFVIWRDVKVRYKQTVAGAAWALLQPLLAAAIFTVVFGVFGRFPSDGVPYPLFAYTALMPWSFAAVGVNRACLCVVNDAELVQHIYFPRLVLPMATVIVPLVDLAPTLLLVLASLWWFGVTPTWAIVTLPLWIGLALLCVMAIGLWLSALNVKYRDVSHAVPFLIQCWMYVSPVIYPLSAVPGSWRLLYSLNPMVGVIEGCRWALLGKAPPDVVPLAASVMVVLLLFAGGLVYFKRMERVFADIV